MADAADAREGEIESLRSALEASKSQLDMMTRRVRTKDDEFDKERKLWLSEKRKLEGELRSLKVRRAA